MVVWRGWIGGGGAAGVEMRLAGWWFVWGWGVVS